MSVPFARQLHRTIAVVRPTHKETSISSNVLQIAGRGQMFALKSLGYVAHCYGDPEMIQRPPIE